MRSLKLLSLPSSADVCSQSTELDISLSVVLVELPTSPWLSKVQALVADWFGGIDRNEISQSCNLD